jgi:hypothetical protein
VNAIFHGSNISGTELGLLWWFCFSKKLNE